MYVQTMENDKARRDACAERIDLIEKIKPIVTIPGTDYVTLRQVADFYSVSTHILNTCYQRYQEEFENDGIAFCTPLSIKSLISKDTSIRKTEKLVGKSLIEFESGVCLVVPNRGIKLFSRKALLRFGSVLRTSPEACKLRALMIERPKTNDIGEALLRTIIADDIVSRIEGAGTLARIYSQTNAASI